MINKVDELLKLADALLFAPNHLRKKRREALRSALEDVLTPSEAVVRLSLDEIYAIDCSMCGARECVEPFSRAIEEAVHKKLDSKSWVCHDSSK